MSSAPANISKGLFIVLEGIDGSGKTTIAKALAESLSKRGFKALYTYEPTDSDVVLAIRGKYRGLRDPYIDSLAFALDRLIHLKLEVEPALSKGFIVISDRYLYSSVAYQSACGAPADWILEINKWALTPDIALYLDVSPEEAIARKKGALSRFPEFEEILLLRKVREKYLWMVEKGLLISVNASRGIIEVYKDVEKLVNHELDRRTTS
ncbi:MAG: dTMP kinase [Desulfurococcaceae archaeon]